jgi:glycosyltransferase involved in cell wall biosynthesis
MQNGHLPCVGSEKTPGVNTLVYVERRTRWFSIEKVFRQIAGDLSADLFRIEFHTLSYGTDLIGMVKNLLSFRRRPADLYHITGQAHFIALLLPPDRCVLTVHDLHFLRTRRGIRRYVLKKLFLDLPMRRVKYVTAISEATRNEIAEHTGFDRAAIRVIPNPLRDAFVFTTEKPFDRDCPTILQVGTTDNKNIPNLIRALDGVRCRLVIVGPYDEQIAGLLAAHRINVDARRDLSDMELAAEYQACDLVAFCTTFEGFGLPIIEAQAMRKPVVTSDLSPMREIAGGGAVLVDPYDVASIRSGIVRVIEDDTLRRDIVRIGQANVERFEPRGVARMYEALYREVLGSQRR